MKLFRTRTLFGIDQLTRIHPSYFCRMSTTPPARYLPPPDHLSGNHLEPVKFRFVRNVNHRVSSPLSLGIAMYCLVILSLPFIFSSPPPLSTDRRYARRRCFPL